nr:uncharacterized protein LOC110383577 isoform X2 [Helicoverpa armigera]
MELLKQTIYFLLFIFFCFHFVQAAPCRKAVQPVHGNYETARRMSNQKNSIQLGKPEKIPMPMPTQSTIDPKILVIVSQLKKGTLLQNKENYEKLLQRLKEDFYPTTTKAPTCSKCNKS